MEYNGQEKEVFVQELIKCGRLVGERMELRSCQ